MLNHCFYHFFTSHEWAVHSKFSSILSKKISNQLLSFDSPIDSTEIYKIYFPLSHLLLINVNSAKITCHQYNKFLNLKEESKIPFVVGITGSVAVGKSTFARILCILLQQISNFKVSLITTDGFLFPNAVLTANNLMQRKGFPESYDSNKLLTFLSDVKSGKKKVAVPRYSHSQYDILEGEYDTIIQPDILLIEGINVLQQNSLSDNQKATPMISDFLDFSIYIDADKRDIHRWYLNRFLKLRETAFLNPRSYFHHFTEISEEQSLKIAETAWNNINLPNLQHNILPTRKRADLILSKGEDHSVKTIKIKKI
ncbi:type I pantothenate kinase [Candidatus Liberibacter asiaticus]